MTIRFNFDAHKAVAAMAYLVSRLEGQKTDKVKLMKLLYLADRDHFLQEGHPITGDDQYAMPYGPAPSSSLNVLCGQFAPEQAPIFDYLQTRDYEVSFKKLPQPLGLADAERQTLDTTIKKYGAINTWSLSDFTHGLDEYQQVFRPGHSTRIPYELLLKIYSSGRLYRHGRPVITPAMAANMSCPFARSEDDL